MEPLISADPLDRLVGESIDFHCHGVGRFDFTEIQDIKLQEIEDILAKRKQKAVLTLYLPKPDFENFLELMTVFNQGKKLGKFRHIVGFALEGPLLASHGGTPEKGVWMPTKHHWKELATCGKKGLIYVILSPDAQCPGSNFRLDIEAPNITWIAETLLSGGVLPTPGHFTKTDPLTSAKELQSIFDVVAAWGGGATITDHLFNDMPLNFKHAWRKIEEKERRDQEIQQLNLESWNLDNLEEKLGPVPAVMIKNARKGLVKLCQNFDGEHVDLIIVKKAVELIGAENMLMMTDSIESKRLAGRDLTMQEGSTLLYQDAGIVAAGTQSARLQIQNMLTIGLSIQQIELITAIVPANIIKQHNNYREENNYAAASYI